MELHEKVADFTLQNEEDQTVHLSDYGGKPVVLFFYPRADTPGCTIEACGFRDTFARLQAAGAVVVGISRDTVKAQKKFKIKYELPPCWPIPMRPSATSLASSRKRTCTARK